MSAKLGTPNSEASQLICSQLIQALSGNVLFSLIEHTLTRNSARTDLAIQNEEVHGSALNLLLHKVSADESHTASGGGLAGQWLTAVPSIVNATSLPRDKFITNVNLLCDMESSGLPSNRDGCGAKIFAEHFLKCKDGRRVDLHHNKVKHELTDLCEKAFTPSSVRDKPHVNPCRCEEEALKSKVKTPKKGDQDR